MTEATLPFQNTVLLVSGIPATGKSGFCRYLAREHGFAHYDLECYPRGWPIPQLHQVWERSRGEFVAELYRLHERVAVDWGFPLLLSSGPLNLRRREQGSSGSPEISREPARYSFNEVASMWRSSMRRSMIFKRLGYQSLCAHRQWRHSRKVEDFDTPLEFTRRFFRPSESNALGVA